MPTRPIVRKPEAGARGAGTSPKRRRGMQHPRQNLALTFPASMRCDRSDSRRAPFPNIAPRMGRQAFGGTELLIRLVAERAKLLQVGEADMGVLAVENDIFQSRGDDPADSRQDRLGQRLEALAGMSRRSGDQGDFRLQVIPLACQWRSCLGE